MNGRIREDFREIVGRRGTAYAGAYWKCRKTKELIKDVPFFFVPWFTEKVKWSGSFDNNIN